MLVRVRDIGDGFGRIGYQNLLSLNLSPIPTSETTKLSPTSSSNNKDVDSITVADFTLELTLGMRSLLNLPSISLQSFQDLIF